MESTAPRPRETPTGNGANPARLARKRFDPTQLFAQRDRLPWFWFFVAVAVSVAAALDRYHIINQFKQRERVVIIDPAQTYYVSPLLQFSEAKDLHAQQAELATVTFLQRNPKDFDHPELMRQMFLKSALEKAQEHRTREAVEFRAKQLHQKPEIAKIDILATRENEVLVAVYGQVIRTGIFQEKVFNEAFNFKLSLRFIRNPTWLPTVVSRPLSATSNMKSPISILLLGATVALAAPPEAIQRVTLDERVVIVTCARK
ncbi:MAG: hypothetical protein L0Z50_21975 [Verrucomicrobiales bacterium]|nr:hypothetical protein [Verrucomicrobiales bacterium]